MAPLLGEQRAPRGLFPRLLDASPGFVAYCDIVSFAASPNVPDAPGHDLIYRYVNARFASLNGQPIAELVGQRMSERFPGVVSSGLLHRYSAVIDSGQSQTFEFHYQYDGIDGWYLNTADLYDGGLVISFLDITARKCAEQEADRQAAQLRAMLDASLNSILMMRAIRDGAGQVVDFLVETANRAVQASLFRSPEALIGRTLLSVFPGNVESGFLALYARVADTGTPEQATYFYQDENGFSGWFAVSANRTETDRIVLTFNNITQYKEAQQAQTQQNEKLARINQNLKQSNDNLQSFAYVASHDLQEPLRKIQQFGNVINHRYSQQLGAEGSDLIGRMQKAADRMSILIRDLLALSRISTHQQLFGWVDLGTLVAEVLGDLELTIRDQDAAIQVGPLCNVVGDAGQLRQLVQNLLTNAIKFTKPGERPRVWVRCQPADPTTLPPMLLNGGSFACLVVADEGIGFNAASYGERIFGAFQRLHGRDEYEGTGIGLAVVKKVVERHHGHVVVESTPGHGATFFVYLPSAQ
jgi:signal transduction histidine kinase